MTGQQIDRDRLRELADEYDDSTIDGGPDMAAGAIRQLLEALDQAEARIETLEDTARILVREVLAAEDARDEHRRGKAAAEARIKAVRDLLDENPAAYAWTYNNNIRRALDGER